MKFILVSETVHKAYQEEKRKAVQKEGEGEQEIDTQSDDIVDDPYMYSIDEETLLDYYDQMKGGAIPEADLSFEYEPNFEPKNQDQYVVNPDQPMIFMKEFPSYMKEHNFVIKGNL